MPTRIEVGMVDGGSCARAGAGGVGWPPAAVRDHQLAALYVAHRRHELGSHHPAFDLVRFQLRHPGLDPVDVAERVADPAHAVAPEHLGHPVQRGGARVRGPLVGRVAVGHGAPPRASV
jgi:hypothetical protein